MAASLSSFSTYGGGGANGGRRRARGYERAAADCDNGGFLLHARTDGGFLLALLSQNHVDGLQVQKDGRWILAKLVPNSFFVIAGDQLEIVSNGRYKAALHYAKVDGEQARMSSVSMIGPSLDAVVQPIPELASQGVEFRGIKYREYMEHHRTKRLGENAALLMARVQGRLGRSKS